VKKIIFAGVLIFLGLVTVFVVSVSLGDYPKLNSCFKTSVSKKLLCSQNPDYVKLSNVSEYFQKAVVMSEDDSFYAHDGFDWKEFRKSMATNLRQFAFVRGGSTITQQLVKNVYLSQKKTIYRKIVEAKLAKKVEKEHSKKIILEKYVNAIEFGKNIWGIKQAAWFYFEKPPLALDPLESLYLVILLPSPVRYSQTFFKKELSSYQRRRMKTLLSRMRRRGIVEEEAYETLKDRLSYFFKPAPEILDDIDDEWAEGEETVEVEPPEEGEMESTELPEESDDDEVIEDAEPVEEAEPSSSEDLETVDQP